jgi:hypothetical protein
MMELSNSSLICCLALTDGGSSVLVVRGEALVVGVCSSITVQVNMDFTFFGSCHVARR